MQVKVKKEFELDNDDEACENEVFNLITINDEIEGLGIILEKNGKIYKVFFQDEFDANEHLKFNYQKNEVCSAEKFITQNEVDRRLAELAKRKDEEVEYWKAKCMKLLDKF